MSSRSQRLALANRDWGDSDDEVLVGLTHQSTRYHDDEDCDHLVDEHESTTRGSAQRRWLAPCLDCVTLREVPG